MRLSAWTFPALRYLGFVLDDERISVEMSGLTVMDLYLSRGRMVSACFRFNLTPDELRTAVSTLRQAGHGIERWIMPGLEFTSLNETFRKDHAKTYAVARKLLESCQDLPVAEQWKRARASVIARHEQAQAEAKPGKPARRQRAR